VRTLVPTMVEQELESIVTRKERVMRVAQKIAVTLGGMGSDPEDLEDQVEVVRLLDLAIAEVASKATPP